jgi:RimJ/RimL family protein N-acetyltransferase
VILETERLVLRELVPSDLDFVTEMLADPEVMRFYPKRYSREEARVWLDRQRERYRRDGHGLWLVSDRATGEPRGQAGLLLQRVDRLDEPEVGYLIHQPYWRQGLASEAAGAVRDFAFETLRKPRVISLIRPDNVPSQGVARKLGMTLWKTSLHADLEHLVFSVASPRASSP